MALGLLELHLKNVYKLYIKVLLQLQNDTANSYGFLISVF